MHWDSERYFTNAKKQKKGFVRNKENTSKMLYTISPPIYQWILYNLLIDKEKTGINRHILLEKDAEFTEGVQIWTFRKVENKNDIYN